MDAILSIIVLLFFPSGLFLLLLGLAYEWVDRKLVARLQNRVGPRWFQPLADTVKLLAKEEIVPDGVNHYLFLGLPVVAVAAVLTAALYVPMVGLTPFYSFSGDLIVTIYLLSVLTISLGLAGSNTTSRFSLIGATRTLTQLFSYEAPFLLALLGPAVLAGSWQINEINAYTSSHWLLLSPQGLPLIIGFVVALIGLVGKLELPPFDAPEAETEIVAGALTEYSGRGLALFHLGKGAELVVGLSLIASFYMGGLANPAYGWGVNVLLFFVKTLALLLIVAGMQTLFTRLRIDQTVGLWWRYMSLVALTPILVMVILKGVMV